MPQKDATHAILSITQRAGPNSPPQHAAFVISEGNAAAAATVNREATRIAVTGPDMPVMVLPLLTSLLAALLAHSTRLTSHLTHEIGHRHPLPSTLDELDFLLRHLPYTLRRAEHRVKVQRAKSWEATSVMRRGGCRGCLLQFRIMGRQCLIRILRVCEPYFNVDRPTVSLLYLFLTSRGSREPTFSFIRESTPLYCNRDSTTQCLHGTHIGHLSESFPMSLGNDI